MSNLSDLKAKLVIHLGELHLDAQEQPKNACDAGELAAAAKAAAKRAKVALEETKATVQRDARANPAVHGIDKTTEGAIAAAVTVNEEVLKAERELIDLQEEADMAESAANAFEHRRSMIKEEVNLWQNNYWGDITVKERQMAPVVDTAQEAGFEQAQGRKRRRKEEE